MKFLIFAIFLDAALIALTAWLAFLVANGANGWFIVVMMTSMLCLMGVTKSVGKKVCPKCGYVGEADEFKMGIEK